MGDFFDWLATPAEEGSKEKLILMAELVVGTDYL